MGKFGVKESLSQYSPPILLGNNSSSWVLSSPPVRKNLYVVTIPMPPEIWSNNQSIDCPNLMFHRLCSAMRKANLRQAAIMETMLKLDSPATPKYWPTWLKISKDGSINDFYVYTINSPFPQTNSILYTSLEQLSNLCITMTPTMHKTTWKRSNNQSIHLKSHYTPKLSQKSTSFPLSASSSASTSVSTWAAIISWFFNYSIYLQVFIKWFPQAISHSMIFSKTISLLSLHCFSSLNAARYV